jgi:hypothetical protein
MDFEKAFTFVFDDPDWLRKVAINALIGIIPIVGQIYLMGWGLEVARRIALGSGEPLPDVDFGTYLGHGFKAFVVALVYTAPIWVFVLVIAAASALIYDVNQGTPTTAANTVAIIAGTCGGLFGLLYGLLMGVMLPAAFTRMVVFGNIKDGLALRAVWDLVRRAPSAYLLVLVGTIVAQILAGIVGGIACGIGVIFTTALYQAIAGHFYGQAYRAATA